ncbi:hypothetical protein P4S72_11205 [Vibrio sp. PP-XX7]
MPEIKMIWMGRWQPLAKTPELAWMLDVRNNPDLKVDWQDVQLVLQDWDYDQSGLTPAAMSLIAIAVAVATGGPGLTLMSATGPLATAVNAGFSAMVVQASSTMLGNGF